jgi:peptidoglycan lytic transglycosylase G
MAAPRRAAGERYADDSYPSRGGGRFGRDDYGSWDEGGPDDTFLPGFGADDAGGRRGRRGRDGEYADTGGYGEYEDASRDRRGGGRGGRRGRGGPNGDWDDRSERRPRRGPVRRLAPWVALLVILTPLIAGGYYAYSAYQSKYHPADYAGAGASPTVTVQVKTGDSASSIGPELVSLGVIASSRALVLAAEHSTNTAGLEPGFYKLNHRMQASLAYAALLNPKDRVQLTVTIPEGKRVSQVVAILAKDTSIPQAQFQQIINNPARLGLPSYAKGKVEGYLFPATYQIQPNESALQILQAMVHRYNQEASSINLAAAATRVNLTSEQVMIEASMVQAEAGHPSDFARIARVIINRLANGMKLQFDSVLLYGQNKFAVNITDAEAAIPGPYNDFLNKGLPPTPISNPGNEAIEAVLHPADGNWLYFLTYTNRPSVFSASPLPGMG